MKNKNETNATVEWTNWQPLLSTGTPHKTEVTIDKTHIKMVDEETDSVFTATVYGKLNIIDSKEIATNMDYVYVSKENVKETHFVETSKLDKLIN